jgi:hypothetical protein
MIGAMHRDRDCIMVHRHIRFAVGARYAGAGAAAAGEQVHHQFMAAIVGHAAATRARAALAHGVGRTTWLAPHSARAAARLSTIAVRVPHGLHISMWRTGTAPPVLRSPDRSP